MSYLNRLKWMWRWNCKLCFSFKQTPIFTPEFPPICAKICIVDKLSILLITLSNHTKLQKLDKDMQCWVWVHKPSEVIWNIFHHLFIHHSKIFPYFVMFSSKFLWKTVESILSPPHPLWHEAKQTFSYLQTELGSGKPRPQRRSSFSTTATSINSQLNACEEKKPQVSSSSSSPAPPPLQLRRVTWHTGLSVSTQNLP